MLVSTDNYMEGGFRHFQKRYGERLPDGTYQVPAKWQTAIGNSTGVGEILGLFLESILADYFSYRKLIFGSLLLMNAFLFIPFFAQNIQTYVAAELLQGIPWGELA